MSNKELLDNCFSFLNSLTKEDIKAIEEKSKHKKHGFDIYDENPNITKEDIQLLYKPVVNSIHINI